MRVIQFAALSAVVVIGFGYTVHAKGEIDAAEARFDVTSPILNGVPAVFNRYHGRQGYVQFDVGRWRDPDTGLNVTVSRTVPRKVRVKMGYTPTVDGEVFSGFGLKKNKSFQAGEKTEADTKFGSAKLQFFSIEGQSCYGFFIPFGYNNPVNASSGFVCAPHGKEVSFDHAAAFITTISQKKAGMPPAVMPPKMSASTNGSQNVRSVPFALKWSGKYDLASGTMNYEDTSGGGSLSVKLPSDQGTCKGNWKTSGGDYNSADKPHGEWTLACSDGSTAVGSFVSPEPGAGAGSGKDSDGNNISVSFGSSI